MRVLAVAVAAVLALTGAACTKEDPAAATVDRTVVRVSQIDRDLADIASNEAFVAGREAEGIAFRGPAPGSFDPGIVAELLNRKVTAILVHDELLRRRRSITPSDRAAAEDALRRQVVAGRSTGSVLDGFPRRYVDAQVTVQAESDVLQADEGRIDLSDDALRRLYGELGDDLASTCARWIVWSPIDAEATTKARAARARIVAGDDFARIAAAESTDTATAAQGGSLGCLPDERFARLGENVAEAIEHLTDGELSAVGTSEVGTYLVQVTERRVQPFDEARSVLRAEALKPAAVPYEALLRRLRAAAAVIVAPRYGTWDTTDPERIRLLPPRP